MLPSTTYGLRIDQTPKGYDLLGNARSRQFDYHVELVWDSKVWLSASAGSPEALGRIVGEAVRGMAETAESAMGGGRFP